MNTSEYIERYKEAKGIGSDYALAEHLGVTRAYISSLKTGRNFLSEELCYRFAEALSIHPAIVLIDTLRQKSTTPKQERVWSDVLEKISVGFNSLLSRRTPRLI